MLPVSPGFSGSTPEHPPGSEELGSEVEQLLSGLAELTALEGGVSASSFVQRALDEADERKVPIDEKAAWLIMRHGFGTPEDARDRVGDISIDEFEETYPGDLGLLLRWYMNLLPEENQE